MEPGMPNRAPGKSRIRKGRLSSTTPRGFTERGVPATPQNVKIGPRRSAIVAACRQRSVPRSFDRSRLPPSPCLASRNTPRRPQPRTEGIRAAPVTQRPPFLERSPSRPLFDLCAPCSFRRGDRDPGHGHSIGMDLRGNPTPSESAAAAVVGFVGWIEATYWRVQLAMNWPRRRPANTMKCGGG
jgi:hypothetical protein